MAGHTTGLCENVQPIHCGTVWLVEITMRACRWYPQNSSVIFFDHDTNTVKCSDKKIDIPPIVETGDGELLRASSETQIKGDTSGPGEDGPQDRSLLILQENCQCRRYACTRSCHLWLLWSFCYFNSEAGKAFKSQSLSFIIHQITRMLRIHRINSVVYFCYSIRPRTRSLLATCMYAYAVLSILPWQHAPLHLHHKVSQSI